MIPGAGRGRYLDKRRAPPDSGIKSCIKCFLRVSGFKRCHTAQRKTDMHCTAPPLPLVPRTGLSLVDSGRLRRQRLAWKRYPNLSHQISLRIRRITYFSNENVPEEWTVHITPLLACDVGGAGIRTLIYRCFAYSLTQERMRRTATHPRFITTLFSSRAPPVGCRLSPAVTFQSPPPGPWAGHSSPHEAFHDVHALPPVPASEEVVVVEVMVQQVQLAPLLEPALLLGQHLEVCVVEGVREPRAPRHAEVRLAVAVVYLFRGLELGLGVVRVSGIQGLGYRMRDDGFTRFGSKVRQG